MNVPDNIKDLLYFLTVAVLVLFSLGSACRLISCGYTFEAVVALCASAFILYEAWTKSSKS